MAITHFDWSTFIAEVTDIPTDVVFQIVEDGEDGQLHEIKAIVEDGQLHGIKAIVEDGQLHEIKAHKIVLGMVSSTFKTMFYTTDIGDKITKQINIEASTKQAFQIIIDELYTIKSIEDSLQGKSVQEIFDVVNLIERYQMENLQKSVNDILSNYPIKGDTVLEVAAEAIHQSGLFQKEPQILLLSCAKFLKPKLKDAKSIFKYFKDNGHLKEVVAALVVLVNDIALIGCSNIALIGCSNIALIGCSNVARTECSNCGYEDCRDGKQVKEDEFGEGLLVTNDRVVTDYGSHWRSYDYGTGKVKSMDAVHVNIETIKSGVVSQFAGSYFPKVYNGHNLFLFMCN